MRPASGVFQKRQHTLSASVLGCLTNGGYWKTALCYLYSRESEKVYLRKPSFRELDVRKPTFREYALLAAR